MTVRMAGPINFSVGSCPIFLLISLLLLHSHYSGLIPEKEAPSPSLFYIFSPRHTNTSKKASKS